MRKFRRSGLLDFGEVKDVGESMSGIALDVLLGKKFLHQLLESYFAAVIFTSMRDIFYRHVSPDSWAYFAGVGCWTWMN